MKNLILISLLSFSASSSFAAHLVCNHGNYSPMIIDVQTDASKAVLKVLKSSDPRARLTNPQAGETAVLLPQQASAGWTILKSAEESQGRGFQLNILTADLAKNSFRAVLSASKENSTMVWWQFEMTCESK